MNLLQIERQRINDSNLIENEITSEIKRSLGTKQFNACRLSTRVTYISALCQWERIKSLTTTIHNNQLQSKI